MVGAGRFELPTSCTPSKRASRTTLRPEPLNAHSIQPADGFNHEDFQFLRSRRTRITGWINSGRIFSGTADHPQMRVRREQVKIFVIVNLQAGWIE